MSYITFQPKDYFNTKLYTGNGSTNAITSVGFRPDWSLIKGRGTTNAHMLFDAVRGVGEALNSNTANAEATVSTAFTSFDTDGFTVGNYSETNTNSENYVSWNWKANGSGSANTDGSISSTVSASTTSGFSIVKWTGTGADGTIGHGLGVAPKMVIVKSLANTTYWMVYHASLGNAQEIFLNTTNASASSTTWNTTTPTSTVISLDGGAGNGVNASGDYIAYCFAEKKGFSKFGSFTGNGNADGTFVYTGFRPAFIMIKRTDTAKPWMMFDNKRDGYNPDNDQLQANSSVVEATNDFLDIVSNGFKLRTTDSTLNTSSGTYIYMCFAEHPIVSSNDIPAVAR